MGWTVSKTAALSCRDRAGHVTFNRILQRIQDARAVGQLARVDASPVAVNVSADRSAIKAEHGFMRQDQRDGIVVGGAPA